MSTQLAEIASPVRPTSLSPEPILKAVENYSGTIFDLDRAVIIGPAQFARRRGNLTSGMITHGLEPGDRVVMAIGTGPQFIAALSAILAAGGSPLLLHGDTPAEEIRRTAQRFDARFAVIDALDESHLRDAGFDPRPLGDDWARIAWTPTPHWPSYHLPPIFLPAVPLHPTSGTTGHPRVAARPGRCAMAEAEHYIETIGIDADDLLLAAPPMSHAYAYGMCVMVPLLSGASIATMRRFSPRLVHDAFDQFGITIFPAVPIMLEMLMFGSRELHGSARCVLTAGAALPDRTAADFRSRFAIPLRPLYGSTETGGIAVAPADGKPLSGEAVGPAMHGVSVEVRAADSEGDFGDDVGLLHVRSSSMMAGYLGDDGLDDSCLDRGWFCTSDLATIGPDGIIRLRGRQAEVINVGGMKVVPNEVEEVISALPGVTSVKVYAGQRRSGATFVKAAIVATPGMKPQTVRAHCEKHLVYYKRPGAIHFVESLPKSPTGKILRDQLP